MWWVLGGHPVKKIGPNLMYSSFLWHVTEDLPVWYYPVVGVPKVEVATHAQLGSCLTNTVRDAPPHTVID